ncbi:uncharacterized protein DUF3822 [Dyadobacter jejuensis]|uniref:Uncharacterized protein DUF3822 n=1 Tax=Dyadobacter jejuensis TaxID=1082580 RepID=A0A316AG29_9BACT|nr:DUF3822 family protein [Dyadobacter jejuensis]PWJ56745.1 uncharacterized protein DUF3822 [Dyadobacter jejuensis]
MAHTENQIIEVIPSLLAGDGSFDVDSIPFCTLCIEVDERRIRFCIVRDENLECVWIEDYGFDKVLTETEVFERLKRIFKGHLLWSSNSWLNVRIAINSRAFSLIPSILFEEHRIHNYLHFAMGAPVSADDKVLYHEVPLVHAHNVFCVPNLWYDWIVNHFSSSHISFYHITSPLIIGALVSHAENEEVKIVSLYFEVDHFTMIVTDTNRLVLCNRYRFEHASELAYIVLFALHQLNLSSEEVRVICYGEISMDSELVAELMRFFSNLSLGRGPTTLRYSKHCGDIPGHRYFGLFNTFLVSS